MAFKVKDSGDRQQFDTGAQRDTDTNKACPGLIHPYFLQRLAAHMTKGAVKYDSWNWTKGIPISRSWESLNRHLLEFAMGMEDEDHLAAAVANLQFIIVTKAMVKAGMLPAELDDMMDWSMMTKEFIEAGQINQEEE